MTEGVVFDIQRLCTHDGPGIRTGVFLKGCPLYCVWCHNPESHTMDRQIFYNQNLGIGCKGCEAVCPNNAHYFKDGVHIYDRNKCKMCMRCVEVCNTSALEIVGRKMTVDEILVEVKKDRIFYEETGGGITISGGEPMMQFEFTYSLLKKAKASDITTCIETCGYASEEDYLQINEFVDLYLWDIKDTNPTRHERYTGVTPGRIIENLKQVDSIGGTTILRCIMIAGINLDFEHLTKLSELYHQLTNCKGIELLPYHNLYNSKLEKLGIKPDVHKEWVPNNEVLQKAYKVLAESGVKVLI